MTEAGQGTGDSGRGFCATASMVRESLCWENSQEAGVAEGRSKGENGSMSKRLPGRQA